MKLQNSFRDYTAESALFVRRALVAFLGILLLTGVLIANLYNLQIVRFTDYQTRSNENRIKLVPIAPSRGIIYDRNGIPLALNRTIYQIEMMPEGYLNSTKCFLATGRCDIIATSCKKMPKTIARGAMTGSMQSPRTVKDFRHFRNVWNALSQGLVNFSTIRIF